MIWEAIAIARELVALALFLANIALWATIIIGFGGLH